MLQTLFFFVLGLGLYYAVRVFNRCIRLRNRARGALQDVDVALKQRADVVPNLVEVVKGYAKHEAGTLTSVVEARARVDVNAPTKARAQTERAFAENLGRALVLFEDYPELRADAQYRKLLDTLIEVEDHIQSARRYYNAVVRDLNTQVQVFPANLLCWLFRFQTMDFFQADVVARAAPRLGLRASTGETA